uniref:Uncharacterized protein n=1 Tax=Anguilla anguilla TaxID=7936 RepID=A0A0E9PSL9_ANGAN
MGKMLRLCVTVIALNSTQSHHTAYITAASTPVLIAITNNWHLEAIS